MEMFQDEHRGGKPRTSPDRMRPAGRQRKGAKQQQLMAREDSSRRAVNRHRQAASPSGDGRRRSPTYSRHRQQSPGLRAGSLPSDDPLRPSSGDSSPVKSKLDIYRERESRKILGDNGSRGMRAQRQQNHVARTAATSSSVDGGPCGASTDSGSSSDIGSDSSSDEDLLDEGELPLGMTMLSTTRQQQQLVLSRQQQLQLHPRHLLYGNRITEVFRK